MGYRLEPRGYVDALAEGVVLVEIDVAQVGADPHQQRKVGMQLVVVVEAVLDLDRALQGVDGILEVDQEGIADGLDDRAALRADDFLDDAVVLGKQLQGQGFVLLHHLGETGDIRIEYGRQAIILSFHIGDQHTRARKRPSIAPFWHT